MRTLQAILDTELLGTATGLWLGFFLLVSGLLVFDLGVLHRRRREIGIAESLWLSAGYISVALMFGVWVWYQMGADRALEFYTGFLIEKSLSLDNIFLMAAIFGFLGIPRCYQHQVLFWGILGVIVLRALMIGLGAALIHSFAWILQLFGLFLLGTGVRMLRSSPDDAPDLARNAVQRFLRQRLRVTDELHGAHFFVHLPDASGQPQRQATPLLLALVMIELTDLLFAVDSIPAIFAITQDTFIVYTSNIFAVLGLRALYFALAAMLHRFVYLKYALALVLVFIGAKIFLAGILGPIPAALSLGVTFALLAGGVLYSLYRTRQRPG